MSSPYLKPGFYDQALEKGKHRDIVGGRWDETGFVQMAALIDEGLEPEHRLLDIGCGCLRLGHLAVNWLDSGHYWGTDASGPLMQRGWEVELSPAAQARLPREQLVEDASFSYAGVPQDIDYAIAFGVFAHLPAEMLRPALISARKHLTSLQKLLFTVFIAPEGHAGAYRQKDGVVTHPHRPPYHRYRADVEADAEAAGFAVSWRTRVLPRGQDLCVLEPI
ncbi:class I SAM-dependent methyltransferase [Xinfangfangia sp. CPCC 101601]|uniref:Class I SAM-dependent methyltransferase n=1 Tax=Pseudogemmobacter lacusdianii TaxID=3069608 RepID=A0ABU0VXC9_9RHOB|nr:class I SAM-dependent methyltransferase [Xinfangfangia sp. CPCC 101601]MDQ2066163.1 class I SAM-dependent methyltransferase [Xinfangfangia sp. CPCC 101601]